MSPVAKARPEVSQGHPQPYFLGHLPSHWEIRRNGRLFHQEIRVGDSNLPILMVSLHDGVTVRDLGDDTHRQIIEDRTKYKRVAAGDIAYNMMRMWQGAVGVCPVDGLVSPAYVTASPVADANAKYYEYVFRLPVYMKEVENYSRGIVSDRNRLYWEDFKQLRSPYPPRSEQDRIVAFLDRQLEQIDLYLATKRRQTELCSEARVSLLGSLLPAAAGKTSTKLKYFVDLIPGYAFPSKQFSTNKNDIRLLRGINIAPGKVRWNETVRWSRHDTMRFKDYQLQVGDLVIGMDRPWISMGIRVAEITGSDVPSLVLQRVGLLRAKPGLEQRFLRLLLMSRDFQAYFEPMLTGISVPHISPEQILDYRVTLPAIREQQRIVTRYAELSASLDAATKNAEEEIGLMTEYRMALITEAVTGRLDVSRGA